MAGSATVGALRVVLSMDAADYETGVRNLSSLTDKLNLRFAAMAGAAAAAGAVLVNSLVGAMRGAAAGFGDARQKVDDLSKAAQKFGVATETLMAFTHSAELAGIGVEQLGKGFAKLAIAMTDLAGGQSSKGAKMLETLGIRATEANGQLRATDAVMIDLAEKFAGMETGAGKTAAAIAIFGEEGAKLIPMLNAGSVELARQRAEADKLGLVLDAQTAKSLERLGDEWGNVGKAVQGFWTQLNGQLSPALNYLVDRINAWIHSGDGVKAWAENVATGIKNIIASVFSVSAAFQRFTVNIQAAGAAMGNFLTLNWSKVAEANQQGADQIRAIDEQLSKDLAGIWAQRLALSAETEAQRALTHAPVIQAQHELTEGERELNRLLEEKARLVEELRTPNEEYAATLERLDILHQHAGLSAEHYGRAMSNAAWTAANAHAGAASKIAGNLQGVFGKAKAFAIAQAVINTYEAFTAALKGPPGPPWSYAIAASTLAAGFAQVANIKSTNPGSGGGGGGGSSAAAGAGGGVGSAPQLLTIQGISADQMYSGGSVRELANQIIKYQNDGGQVLVK